MIMVSRRRALLGAIAASALYAWPPMALAKPSMAEIAAATLACQRLSADYAFYVDTKDPEAYAALFAQDATLQLGAPAVGREAILATIKGILSRMPYSTRHVFSNFRIDVIDADHAVGTAYVEIYHFTPDAPPSGGFQPALLGVYTDTFVRTAQGWRFQTRALKGLSAKP